MNERIKQLADQAGFVLWGDKVALISGDTVDWSSRYDDELEKFAELIIKESITEMEKHDYHATWLGEKLKQHFGVKE